MIKIIYKSKCPHKPGPRWRNRSPAPFQKTATLFLPVTKHTFPYGYHHYLHFAIIISVLFCVAFPALVHVPKQCSLFEVIEIFISLHGFFYGGFFTV